MKMEQTECSETSAYKIQTPGNYPEESIQHLQSNFKISTKSMYKIQVARVKLSNLISKSKFINTNQMSIHLFPVMHLYALQSYLPGRYT
jgi:hypothetical protein